MALAVLVKHPDAIASYDDIADFLGALSPNETYCFVSSRTLKLNGRDAPPNLRLLLISEKRQRTIASDTTTLQTVAAYFLVDVKKSGILDAVLLTEGGYVYTDRETEVYGDGAGGTVLRYVVTSEGFARRE
ncbi:MAG TPA: hypothetical protein VKP88_02545 [Candidatus Paceibacterota bacterium]|nr:hypothetical protein [Candidatus Paceibacterota bacterium]